MGARSNEIFIGVDFGGTTITAGAVARGKGEIIALKTVRADDRDRPGEQS